MKGYKLAVAGAILLLVIALVYKTFQGYVPYLSISELKDGRNNLLYLVRVHCRVKGGTINYDNKKMILTFDAFETGEPSSIIHVINRGIKLASLKPDVDVVLEGKYDQHTNTFDATTLLVEVIIPHTDGVKSQYHK